jgi:hypothetical protein
MMFRAFFDESGLDPKADKTLVVGGFFSTAEEWQKASDAWDSCLSSPPAISHFSHHEATSCDGPFKKFSSAQALKKMEKLAGIIADHNLQGFCATVSYSWFASRDSKASRKATGTRPYDWGFLTTTRAVLQFVEMTGVPDKVDFIFDRRKELDACIATFNEMKSYQWLDIMKFAGECIPGDDEELVALQMADLLSGEFANLISTRISSNTWKILVNRYPVVHVPCVMPPRIPNVLELQKVSRAIKIDCGRILKRIYRDKEKSMELLVDVRELMLRKAYFDLQFQRLKSSFQSETSYTDFISDLHKREQ